jgi:hypothetical protein
MASTWVLLAMAGAMDVQNLPVMHDDAHRRAEALLGQMTVEEKAGQLNQASGIVIPGWQPKSRMTPSSRAKWVRCCGNLM